MKIICKTIFFICLLFGSSIVWAQSKHSNSHKTHSYKTHKNKKHKKVNYMQGVASYYGDDDGFAGKQMANGDIFNPRDIYAAAHPTLALGTKLKVNNLRNGRTIYVEVSDRMPRNKSKRIIDLSVAAAKYLGMYHRGVTYVKLTKVSEDEFEKNKGYLYVDDNDSGKPY